MANPAQEAETAAERLARGVRERSGQAESQAPTGPVAGFDVPRTDTEQRMRSIFDRPLADKLRDLVRAERAAVEKANPGARVTPMFDRQRVSALGIEADEEGFPALKRRFDIGRFRNVAFGVEDPIGTGEGGAESTIVSASPLLMQRIDRARKEHAAALDELEKNARGVELDDRFFGNVKLTPQGKFGFLGHRYGPENVLPVYGEEGLDQIIIFKPGEDPLIWDERDINFTNTLKDLVDISPDLIEAIPGMIAAGITLGRTRSTTAAMGVGGAVDALSNIARQGLDETLPGPSLGDVQGTGGRAREFGVAVGAGMAGEGITGVARAGLRAADVPTSSAEVIGRGTRKIDPATGVERSPTVAGRMTVNPETGRLQKGAVDLVPAGEAARESQALADEFGIDLALDQATMHGSLVQFGDALRRLPGSSEVFNRFTNRQLVQQVRAVERVIDTNLELLDPATAGVRAKRAVKNYHNVQQGLRANHRAASNTEFGAAIDMIGDRPVVRLDNVLEEADELIQNLPRAAASPESKMAASLAQEIREEVTGSLVDRHGNAISGGAFWSIKDTQAALHNWGDAAFNAADPTLKRAYTVLKEALERDLDELIRTNPATEIAGRAPAEEGLVVVGPGRTLPGRGQTIDVTGEFSDALPQQAAKALREARDAYLTRERAIEATQSSFANKVLGKLAKSSRKGRIPRTGLIEEGDLAGGSQMIRDILNADPDELAHLFGALRQSGAEGPALTRQLERGVIEALAVKAAPTAEQAARGVEINPAKFAKLIRQNISRLRAMGSQGAEREAVDQLEKLAPVLLRASRNLATGSATAPRLGVMDLVTRLMPANVVRNFPEAVEAWALLWHRGKLARIFTERDKAKAFMRLVDPEPGVKTAEWNRLLTQLTADVAFDEEMEPSAAVQTEATP